MFFLFVLIGMGSFFPLNSGLSLISSEFLTTSGFSLICQVQGSITTAISISDPLGNVAAACLQPPSGCGSLSGYAFDRNIPDGTFTLYINQTNVHLTNHRGNWTCTDGNDVARFDVKEIGSFTKPVIQTEEAVPKTGTVITVLIKCIYPYPDEVKISYVKKTSKFELKSQNDVKFDNGTSTNCPVPDTRAISMNGTFLLSNDNLNEEALIAVTLLLNGIPLGPPEYSNFTIQSGKENESSNTGLIVGVTFGVIAFMIIVVVVVVYVYKKKSKGGMSRDDNGVSENNTGSNTTKNEAERRTPPTSASKIQLADKLKS